METTLTALRAEGKLDDADEAVVEMVRGLARAVDADPSNAALWRELRAALGTLREAGADDSDDDTRDFIVSIQTPRRAKVGNATQS